MLGKNAKLRSLFFTVVLNIFGVVIAFILIEMLFRTNPNLVPGEVRVNPPVRRINPFRDEMHQVKLSHGDLWHWMKGAIQPLELDQDRVVARVHFTNDAYGFRNSSPEKSTYDIVALGDSFTGAQNVAIPWPERLAEYTGKATLNLGEPAFGPQQELEVLRQFGLKKQPQWIIMTYFEGNDLHDVEAYFHSQPFITLRLLRHMLLRSIEKWNSIKLHKSNSITTAAYGIAAAIDRVYKYPISITIGGAELKMAFFDKYISWLSASREAINGSKNYQLLTETLLQVQELSEAAGARFLFVYIPSKPHLYLPYLDNDSLTRVLVDVQTVELNKTGFLGFTSQTATPALIRQHIDDQAGVLAEFVAKHNIAFLDLTPHFRAEAASGAELYYPFDTHWNQNGHNLAAQAIANKMSDALRNKPTDSSKLVEPSLYVTY